MCWAFFIQNAQSIEYHQSHPINSPSLRIINRIRTTTFYPINIPSMVSSLVDTLLYLFDMLSMYSASTSHPHAMGSNPLSSYLLPLAAWWSRRASLYRCTRREIATWVVADIIWKRCSLQTHFLDEDPPSVPPTMLAANWWMSSLPSFPMRPKLSIANVTNLWTRLSKDTCRTRAYWLRLRASEVEAADPSRSALPSRM